MNLAAIQSNVEAVAQEFAAARPIRQTRRHLDRADFDKLASTGFMLMPVPTELGGAWTSIEESTRPISNALRTLARGDASVALVSAMHPAVLSFWFAPRNVPPEHAEAWSAQQRLVADTAKNGHWWGTITSEPGSGGDVSRTKSTAVQQDGQLLLTGQKHFGSGSGITSYVITSAIKEGDAEADWFFMDVAGAAWDGSSGIQLISEWDGHGMIATQSHAFEFANFPVTPLAWPGSLNVLSAQAGPLGMSLFTAVTVGVAEEAFERAAAQIGRRVESLGAYEKAEWTRAENEMFLIHAAFEAGQQAVEVKGSNAGLEALQAKTTIAELSESLLARICKVIGGGTFHRSSHFGAAFEDVRALGFLRPTWSLAYELIWARSWEPVGQEGPGVSHV